MGGDSLVAARSAFLRSAFRFRVGRGYGSSLSSPARVNFLFCQYAAIAEGLGVVWQVVMQARVLNQGSSTRVSNAYSVPFSNISSS